MTIQAVATIKPCRVNSAGTLIKVWSSLKWVTDRSSSSSSSSIIVATTKNDVDILTLCTFLETNEGTVLSLRSSCWFYTGKKAFLWLFVTVVVPIAKAKTLNDLPWRWPSVMKFRKILVNEHHKQVTRERLLTLYSSWKCLLILKQIP